MKNSQDRFPLVVRSAVVGVLLVAAAIAVQNVWQRVMASEQTTLNDASGEYKGVEKISFLRSPEQN